MSVFADYAAQVTQPTLGQGTERYDEMVRPDGTLRAPWRAFAEVAVSMSAPELRRVGEEIVRTLADEGVTYARPGRRAEAWRLDPVPLVLDAATWGPLEVGLAQRAELLNAVLVDLYGEQRLLAEGVVPAAAVLGHGGFVRAVARPDAVEPRPLVLSATDLVRDAAGEWRVAADRTQAPSGIGYAIENRRVIARVLPELYRDARLHRLEPYVAALRSALLQSATGDLADPRVVVLTPGTRSETAYDQAAIATALGFPLVQGRDLVVRDGFLYLRSPGGAPQRVDVVLRRVDAAWCDPLELRADSRLGVAGLTEVVRRGTVRVVNGLGSGVLESPALMPYLPAACEALLGEPLRLPSVATWWCGDPAGLGEVLDRIGSADLALRPVDGALEPPGGVDPDELRRRVLAEPHRWVGQERPRLSQAPVWQDGVTAGGRVQPRAVGLRTFILRYGSAYRPLAGGLATVYGEDPAPSGAPAGASSKDVWVLKADPADVDQGLAEVLSMSTGRTTSVAVPRVLDDMHWIGRYAERAEDLLRLVLVVHELADDHGAASRSTGPVGLEVVRQGIRRLAGGDRSDVDLDLRSLLLDPSRPGGVAASLAGLQQALSGVRDQLSPDVWRAVGGIERAMLSLLESDRVHQVAESAGRMLTNVLALHGATASMIRDEGWHMIAVGRSVERALQVCHLLAATATVRRGIDVDREVLDAVLVAAESAVTHRRRFRGHVRTGGVLELLITDATNPRSVAFALDEVARHLPALPGSTGSTRPERLVADLVEEVRTVDVAALVAIGGASRPHLETFLDSMVARLGRLAAAVLEVHVDAGPLPRPLASLARVDSLPERG